MGKCASASRRGERNNILSPLCQPVALPVYSERSWYSTPGMSLYNEYPNPTAEKTVNRRDGDTNKENPKTTRNIRPSFRNKRLRAYADFRNLGWYLES